jgi:SepF-like predicted cell division protein (DUF552 family)
MGTVPPSSPQPPDTATVSKNKSATRRKRYTESGRHDRMGLMDDILGGGSRRRQTGGEYVELDIDDIEGTVDEPTTQVHIARIEGQRDVIDIKNAIYDGDIVVADITRHSTTDRTMERITQDLQEITREVGGDIVQKADDQLIITPGSVGISRTKLGQ